MSADIRDKFRDIHRAFDEVFSPQFGGYNGAVGPFQPRVNMGPNHCNGREEFRSTLGASYRNCRLNSTSWNH